MGEEHCNVGWHLLGEPCIVECLWGECVSTVIKHWLREVVGHGGCLDVQAAQHGIGEPAAKELDCVAVHTSAEEGGGAAWSKRAR